MKPPVDNHYPAELTLRQARDEYFARNGFDKDGGYGKKWERMKLGPLVFYIPNSDGRVRALRAHDLHHVMTGYATDWRGEFEIAAWELSSGCADHRFAWLINLVAMNAGLLRWPGAVFRAFVRGRHSTNFYRSAYDGGLLSARVGEMRERLGVDRPPPPARGGDVLAFLAYVALAVPVSLGWLVVLPLILPYAVVTSGLRRRDAATVLSEERA